MTSIKNKFLFYIINFLLFIWQLPQGILGLIFLLIFRNKETYTNPCSGIAVWNVCSGKVFKTACFSLGPIIVTCKDACEETLKHETGHSLQSIRLSWLYLLVVGLTSVCLFWYRRIAKKDMDFYYSHFPENWAEKLGQTNRYRNKFCKK